MEQTQARSWVTFLAMVTVRFVTMTLNFYLSVENLHILGEEFGESISAISLLEISAVVEQKASSVFCETESSS